MPWSAIRCLCWKGNSVVESFETYRTYLFSIAYRILGSAMDAEDIVQESYLRYRAADLRTFTRSKRISPRSWCA